MNPFIDSTVARPLSGFSSPARVTRRALAGVALGLAFLATPASAVNVNAATAGELRGVPGIGPKTAEVIVAERQRGGAYASMEDLSDRVKGIGPKKAARLAAAGLVVVPAGSAVPTPSAGPVAELRTSESAHGAGGKDEGGALSRLSGFLAR